MPASDNWDETRGRVLIAEHQACDGAALPILHALQSAFGHVPRAALPLIAEALNVTRAELHGIVSFYHDFRHTPPGRHVLRLCRAEACQAMGADELAARVQQQLKIGWGETTLDGSVTLEPVFCLGLCACAPAAMFDGAVLGRIDAVRLGGLLEEAADS